MKIEADASADLLAHQGDYQGAAKVSGQAQSQSTDVHTGVYPLHVPVNLPAYKGGGGWRGPRLREPLYESFTRQRWYCFAGAPRALARAVVSLG